jgi:hypothetical protein
MALKVVRQAKSRTPSGLTGAGRAWRETQEEWDRGVEPPRMEISDEDD